MSGIVAAVYFAIHTIPAMQLIEVYYLLANQSVLLVLHAAELFQRSKGTILPFGGPLLVGWRLPTHMQNV